MKLYLFTDNFWYCSCVWAPQVGEVFPSAAGSGALGSPAAFSGVPSVSFSVSDRPGDKESAVPQ